MSDHECAMCGGEGRVRISLNQWAPCMCPCHYKIVRKRPRVQLFPLIDLALEEAEARWLEEER